MELLPITLAANETRQFAKAGRYFEIIDSTYAVTIQFVGTGGNISDSMTGALSGLFIEDPFTHFSVTNGAAAQTITLLIMETGRGGSRRQPGNVAIVDSIGSLVQTVGVASALAVTGGLATVLVAPVAGVSFSVRSLSLESTAGAGGNIQARLIAAPAPVTSYNGAFLVIANLYNPTSSSKSVDAFDLKKRLPVGWGIYLVSFIGAVAATSCSAFISYE